MIDPAAPPAKMALGSFIMMQNLASRRDAFSHRDWSLLSDEQQLALSQQALLQAVHSVAGQAEGLARAIEAGDLDDRGGPDALRLLARLLSLVAAPQSAGGHA